GNVCKLRLDLLEHAQVLTTDARLIHGQAREIALWTRQAMDEALCDCVSDADEHDWDRAGLALKRCADGSWEGKDHVGMQGEQFLCKRRVTEVGESEGRMS